MASSLWSISLKMLNIFVFFSLIGLYSAAQLLITHTPSHVKFLENAGKISSSEIPKAVSLAMGFSVDRDMEWKGLAESNPFKRPKASVVIAIETSVPVRPAHALSYPVENDYPVVQLESVVNNIESTFLEKNPLIVDLAADNTMFELKSRHADIFHRLPSTLANTIPFLKRSGSILDTMETGTLNVTNKPDLALLAELQIIKEIMFAIKDHKNLLEDSTPDLFSFGLTGLKDVVSSYGEESQITKDAVQLVEKFVEQITSEFQKFYKDNVVIEVVTLPPADGRLIRKSRSLLADPTKAPQTDKKKYNLGEDYDEMYPVAFNIILWMMIVLALALFAVSLGLWHMDPGRDSIIYRMTSQRMKKE
ncbi:renin receptor-like [Lineus longissimus]|uniref:renin receptor-like n=1 Tax=Lineus longissimus TaxID=88925 RepID=UPI002B4CD63D